MNFTAFLIVIAVFLVMNGIGFASMGIDKRLAKEGKRRIPEAILFLFALFGGVGSTFGMRDFRHKTKHWYFAVFFPILALLNVAALVGSIYLFCL